jgi:hypothetical protein
MDVAGQAPLAAAVGGMTTPIATNKSPATSTLVVLADRAAAG